MGNINSDVASFRVDNESATIVNLTGSTGTVNSIAPSGGQVLLDDTGVGDSRHTVVKGLANATEITVNGYVNSTTEAIFTPLLDGTSITKTIGIGLVSGQYLNGEAWPRDVSFSVGIDELQTWSCTFQAADGLTRTSVAAA
jgi:hypothetical protein